MMRIVFIVIADTKREKGSLAPAPPPTSPPNATSSEIAESRATPVTAEQCARALARERDEREGERKKSII